MSKRHIVDLGAPHVWEFESLRLSWIVREHILGGLFEFGVNRIELYQHDGQRLEGGVPFRHLRETLEGQCVSNVNLLRYLLAHPELIPIGWKTKRIFFWGTIYRHMNGALYVDCLEWDNVDKIWRHVLHCEEAFIGAYDFAAMIV